MEALILAQARAYREARQPRKRRGGGDQLYRGVGPVPSHIDQNMLELVARWKAEAKAKKAQCSEAAAALKAPGRHTIARSTG